MAGLCRCVRLSPLVFFRGCSQPLKFHNQATPDRQATHRRHRTNTNPRLVHHFTRAAVVARFRRVEMSSVADCAALDQCVGATLALPMAACQPEAAVLNSVNVVPQAHDAGHSPPQRLAIVARIVAHRSWRGAEGGEGACGETRVQPACLAVRGQHSQMNTTLAAPISMCLACYVQARVQRAHSDHANAKSRAWRFWWREPRARERGGGVRPHGKAPSPHRIAACNHAVLRASPEPTHALGSRKGEACMRRPRGELCARERRAAGLSRVGRSRGEWREARVKQGDRAQAGSGTRRT